MAKFKAAIFDWAGTTVDFGSFAPMGAAKWNHIHALLQMREYPNNELQRRGTPRLACADIDAIFEVFVPMNETVAA